MPWLDELVILMEDRNVAEFGRSLFTSTRSSSPVLPSGEATLVIVETSGSASERVQNDVLTPGYLRLAAQFTAKADTYAAAKAMAQAAYNALIVGRDPDDNPLPIKNVLIFTADPVGDAARGLGLASGWYREIRPLQEPFDPGVVDDRRQARCGFNVIATRRA